MPRVVAWFVVGGSTSGFPGWDQASADKIVLEFVMFDDGSCVAAALEPPGFFVESVSASIDLVESTTAMPFYACRFTLVQCEEASATRCKVVGVLSKTKGLEAQCILHGDPGSVVVSYPFNLPILKDDLEVSAPTAQKADETIDLIEDEGPRPVEMVFRGKQVDSDGKAYATTLYLTKTPGLNRVEGYARESLRKSPIAGTWEGENVRFRLAYPLKKGVVYNYDYDGKVVENAAAMRLVGTWRFAGGEGSQQAYGTVLHGKFDVVHDKSFRVAP